MFRKVTSILLTISFLFTQTSFAQAATVELNLAGYLSRMQSNLMVDTFRPLHLRYFSYDTLNNTFKVLLDKGDAFRYEGRRTKDEGRENKAVVPHSSSIVPRNQEEFQSEVKQLMQYFLIGLTLPNDFFWVNLRPDSPDQIIDNQLALTDVGKVMLETDLQLKKDTAMMTSPQTPEGKEYWNKLYKKAEELYGSENITIPTLTRPWIVPGEIIVRETAGNMKDEGSGTKDVNAPSAYIYKATLKVMLEQDYLRGTIDEGGRTKSSIIPHPSSFVTADYSFKDERSKALNEYSSQLIRELIIPKLTKEVNTSKKYAALRQVYYSLILSRWFKERFRNSSQVRVVRDEGKSYIDLIDKQDLTNLTSKTSWSKDTYFNAYKKSFTDGEYNIKEPVYTPTGQVIRSYFSGGVVANLNLLGPSNKNPTAGTFLILGNETLAGSPILPNTVLLAGQADIYGINLSASPTKSVALPEQPSTAASALTIPVETYLNPQSRRQVMLRTVRRLLREYGGEEGVVKNLNSINEYAGLNELVEIDETSDYNGQIIRGEATEELKATYRDSRNKGEWLYMRPAGGDATRLGLGIGKILLNLKQLLTDDFDQLEIAMEKAKKKGEMSRSEIQQIHALRENKEFVNALRSITILKRIMEQLALDTDEKYLHNQNHLLITSEGDEQLVADLLYENDYFGFSRQGIVIMTQAKDPMIEIFGKEAKLSSEFKKAGGNGVPIIESDLPGKAFIINVQGELERLQESALEYFKTKRKVKYVLQGTIGDLRAWSEDPWNEEFVGSIIDKLHSGEGEIVAAGEYVEQNPDLPQKGGTVLLDHKTGKVIAREKVGLEDRAKEDAPSDKKINFLHQPLATFTHAFAIETFQESLKDSVIPFFLRQDKDTKAFFSELVGMDIMLTALQNKGHKVATVIKVFPIKELKGTKSLLSTYPAAWEQDVQRRRRVSAQLRADFDVLLTDIKRWAILKIRDVVGYYQEESLTAAAEEFFKYLDKKEKDVKNVLQRPDQVRAITEWLNKTIKDLEKIPPTDESKGALESLKLLNRQIREEIEDKGNKIVAKLLRNPYIETYRYFSDTVAIQIAYMDAKYQGYIRMVYKDEINNLGLAPDILPSVSQDLSAYAKALNAWIRITDKYQVVNSQIYDTRLSSSALNAVDSQAPGRAGSALDIGKMVEDLLENLKSRKVAEPETSGSAVAATPASMLIDKVAKLGRVEGGIKGGVGVADVHGRIFKPVNKFFTDEGIPVVELDTLIDSLSDKTIQELIHAGIMYYDIRSKFWRDNPAFTTAFTLAFAKKLQEKTGKEDGIILHLAVDAYHKHFETAQVFADAILRTGICDNGGGIYYWGVLNGGDVRNYAQLYEAVNGEGGHWVLFTMSHRKEDFLGAKMGINAQVFCGPEVRHTEGVTSGTLYDTIIGLRKSDFVELKHKTPVGTVINIDPQSILENNIQVAADMIRATSAKSDIPNNEILQGLKIYVDMGGNPVSQNLVEMLKGLGLNRVRELGDVKAVEDLGNLTDLSDFDLIVANAKLDPSFNTSKIIDPNEHRSEPIQLLKKIVQATGRIALYLDPDGDRAGMTAVAPDGNAVSFRGSQLLLTSIENLAVNYPVGPTIICDMRASLSAKDLERALNEIEYPVKVVPFEAGYPFFMRGMADLPADIAGEDTLHFFINPMTNPNWGAPRGYRRPDGKGYQGGDNGALYLIYVLGCIKHQWSYRNPARQLEHLRRTYNLEETVADEKKPVLAIEDDAYKYLIAERMVKLAQEWFSGKGDFLINFNDPNVKLVSGVHITNAKTHAMVLVRFSNSGPGFTITGEGYLKEGAGLSEVQKRAELDEMLGVGYELMTRAVRQLQDEGHEFTFYLKDAEDLKGKFNVDDYLASSILVPPQAPKPFTSASSAMEAAKVGDQPAENFEITKMEASRTTALGSDTVRVDIELAGGAKGYYIVPAGTSTGARERPTVGVEKALKNIEKIREAVKAKGLRADQLVEIAQVMFELDKQEPLGAEATLAYQMAAAWAAARQQGLELYEFLGQLAPDLAAKGVPQTKIQYNITNGGEHADNDLDMQEFMIKPIGETTEDENRMCDEIDEQLGLIYRALGLEANPYDNGIGDLRGKEGGYRINNLTIKKLQEDIYARAEEIYARAEKKAQETGKLNILRNLDLVSLRKENISIHEFIINCKTAAIKNAGYKPSTSGEVGTVALAFDPATTSMLVKGHSDLYEYEGSKITSNQLIELFGKWVYKKDPNTNERMYPIDSIEDGLGEDDWDNWIKLIKRVGDDVLIIADDLLVTQGSDLMKFIKMLDEAGLIKDGKVTKRIGILIKLNQNGFLTTGINNPEDGYMGTLEVIRLARQYGIEVVISHRSKEAEAVEREVSIADLAAAVDAYALKSGDHVQAMRAVKEDRSAWINAREIVKAEFVARGTDLQSFSARVALIFSELHYYSFGYKSIEDNYGYLLESLRKTLAIKDSIIANFAKRATIDNAQEIVEAIGKILADMEYTLQDYQNDDGYVALSHMRDKLTRIIRLEKQKVAASAIAIGVTEKSVSSPGGIDFKDKAMASSTVYQPMGSFVGLDFSLPTLSSSMLLSFDLDKEAQSISSAIDGGILISGQRIKEFMAASALKGEFDKRREEVIIWLAKLGILEETQCCTQETSKEYREALVIVDSYQSI